MRNCKHNLELSLRTLMFLISPKHRYCAELFYLEMLITFFLMAVLETQKTAELINFM